MDILLEEFRKSITFGEKLEDMLMAQFEAKPSTPLENAQFYTELSKCPSNLRKFQFLMFFC